MKSEGVIATSFLIERQRQIQLFQIKVPREVKNIIGIEMSAIGSNGIVAPDQNNAQWALPLTFKRNIVLGELKLQSYEAANVFYTGELTLNTNSDNADFSSEYFIPKPYTHEYLSCEDVTTVSGRTTILQGAYRDKLADQQGGNYNYTVNVYVWWESKDKLN